MNVSKYSLGEPKTNRKMPTENPRRQVNPGGASASAPRQGTAHKITGPTRHLRLQCWAVSLKKLKISLRLCGQRGHRPVAAQVKATGTARRLV